VAAATAWRRGGDVAWRISGVAWRRGAWRRRRGVALATNGDGVVCVAARGVSRLVTCLRGSVCGGNSVVTCWADAAVPTPLSVQTDRRLEQLRTWSVVHYSVGVLPFG